MYAKPSLPELFALATRAAFDLAQARLALSRIRPGNVVARNERIANSLRSQGANEPELDLEACCDEVAFYIPRMASRVPWRSDCLVQALAGQSWLARRGVASEIRVGASKGTQGRFQAHAWLSCGERIVLGGDISGYRTLIESTGRTG